MKTQYIVNVVSKEERKNFYEYIVNTYKLNMYYPFSKRRFINSNFPFVIDFKEKSFWVCESITCCACAAQTNNIFTINQFKAMTKNGFEKYER